MKNLFLSITIYFIFLLEGLAQNITLGITAGSNMNFTAVKSKYEFASEIKYAPLPRYTFGLTLGKVFTKKLNGQVSFLFDRRGSLDNTNAEFRDDFGLDLGSAGHRTIINNYLKTQLNVSYNLNDKFAIGTGINFYTLINAKTKTHNGWTGNFNNYHYKTFNFNVPIFLSYSFYKFNMKLIFDKGLFNRIKDNSAYIKEVENTLTFQFTWMFLGKVL